MNKVVTINLGGMACQLEEGGYDLLRAYLETAAARLQANPDREEILKDIEWAIAEKFRALLGSNKNVVAETEVATVLTEMGPIEADPGGAAGPGGAGTGGGTPFGADRDTPGSRVGGRPTGPGGAGASGTTGAAGAASSSGTPKRLHRIPDGTMIAGVCQGAGVCNGIAAYLQIDPTLVRLSFVFLSLLWGSGIIAYVIMAIVVPEAVTPEEKAAATGSPSTAQEFIRRARAGYYEALKGFPDRQARREWKRRFRWDMRLHGAQWQRNWQNYWAKHAPFTAGMGFFLPLFSILHGLVTVVWVCAVVSLLATGAVLGLALPPNVPVWVAVVGLFIIYAIFTAPLKLARRACHWGIGRAHPAWSLVFLADAVIWLAVFAALLGLGCHYLPEVRDAINRAPTVAHQGVNDVKAWWNRK